MVSSTAIRTTGAGIFKDDRRGRHPGPALRSTRLNSKLLHVERDRRCISTCVPRRACGPPPAGGRARYERRAGNVDGRVSEPDHDGRLLNRPRAQSDRAARVHLRRLRDFHPRCRAQASGAGSRTAAPGRGRAGAGSRAGAWDRPDVPGGCALGPGHPLRAVRPPRRRTNTRTASWPCSAPPPAGAGTFTAQVRNTSPTKLNTAAAQQPGVALLADCGFGSQNQFFNQGWYDNVIAVDPADPEPRVGGRASTSSAPTTAARTGAWPPTGGRRRLPDPCYVHADQHAIVFHPEYDGDRQQDHVRRQRRRDLPHRRRPRRGAPRERRLRRTCGNTAVVTWTSSTTATG